MQPKKRTTSPRYDDLGAKRKKPNNSKGLYDLADEILVKIFHETWNGHKLPKDHRGSDCGSQMTICDDAKRIREKLTPILLVCKRFYNICRPIWVESLVIDLANPKARSLLTLLKDDLSRIAIAILRLSGPIKCTPADWEHILPKTRQSRLIAKSIALGTRDESFQCLLLAAIQLMPSLCHLVFDLKHPLPDFSLFDGYQSRAAEEKDYVQPWKNLQAVHFLGKGSLGVRLTSRLKAQVLRGSIKLIGASEDYVLAPLRALEHIKIRYKGNEEDIIALLNASSQLRSCHLKCDKIRRYQPVDNLLEALKKSCSKLCKLSIDRVVEKDECRQPHDWLASFSNMECCSLPSFLLFPEITSSPLAKRLPRTLETLYTTYSDTKILEAIEATIGDQDWPRNLRTLGFPDMNFRPVYDDLKGKALFLGIDVTTGGDSLGWDATDLIFD